MQPHPPSPRTHSLLVVLAVLGVAFAGLLAVSPRAAAITYVSGFISTDTTWGLADNVYVVTGHVTVLPRITLTILPKTTVRFDPSMGLFVEGQLTADGSAGAPITFTLNNSILPRTWMGVQFNMSSMGSVTRSVFDRVDRAITATDSSPTIRSNTILSAGIGVALVRSSADVTDNTVVRASAYGVYLNQSDAQVLRNSINNTFTGIQAEWFGSPAIEDNVITNGSGAFTVGISVQKGAAASLWNNRVTGIRGSPGLNGASAGANGAPGGSALGILVSGAPSATVVGNTIESVLGGRGGNGADNPGGTGGTGGPGGIGAGIIVATTPDVSVGANTVPNRYGGRGGNGGGTSGFTTNGGRGGEAGPALAFYILYASSSTSGLQNLADGIFGGIGGNGGTGGTTDGSGGRGGDVGGFYIWNDMAADVSGNTVQNLRGGLGGNSSATGTG